MELELRGVIAVDSEVDVRVTCCKSVPNILIGQVPLFIELQNHFSLSGKDFYKNDLLQSPRHSLRYVVLDSAPNCERTFEQQSAETVVGLLYGQYCAGCYSEWTCGYGGFDYVLGEGGHSIFRELASYAGKYIHLQLQITNQ